MKEIRIIRNEDVNRVLIGVPEGHKHLRVCLKLKDGSAIIFQEATMANILRAYITIKTHPSVRAQELKIETLAVEQRKRDYAAHQLLETSRKNGDIEGELRVLLKEGKPIT